MQEGLTPRTNPFLFGHEAAEQAFIEARQGGRLPHAWLLCGMRGIGKATFAFRIARMMLAGAETGDMSAEHPVFRRVAAGSHTDLLVLSPAYDEKKEEEKQEIPVEEARRIGEFLALTPAESNWRVVIVDCADALNVNAANALLKLLEEPPARSLLLLVSHNPASLLPTIRSRCRMLRLPPLPPAAFRRVMHLSAAELPEDALRTLEGLSGGSPGIALELHALEGVAMHEEISILFAGWPRVDVKRLLALCAKLQAAPVHARWRAASALILRVLARAAMQENGASAAEEKAIAALLRESAPAQWARRHAAAAQWLSDVTHAHLDYRSALIALFEGKAFG